MYVRRGDGVAFFASSAPTREALVKRVVLRTMKWLKRKGYVREDLDAHASNESKPLSPLEALAMLAMQRGTFETVRDSEDSSDDEDDASASKNPGNVVAHLGFNLHAGVTIAAHDDLGREPVSRGCSRHARSCAPSWCPVHRRLRVTVSLRPELMVSLRARPSSSSRRPNDRHPWLR